MLKGKRAIAGFICLVGFMLILVGLRLDRDSYGLGGLNVPAGAVFEMEERWERVDFDGDIREAEDILKQLRATEVRREFLQCSPLSAECSTGGECDGCIIIIYGFSVRLPLLTEERWGVFNVMIAVRGGRVAVGYPVLVGSF